MNLNYEPIVPQCEGCLKINGNFCAVYLIPKAKWRSGNCPMATNLKKEKAENGKFVDPLKASKKAMKKI
jgi:hypothetical protein